MELKRRGTCAYCGSPYNSDARIAALEAQVREREAECERLREEQAGAVYHDEGGVHYCATCNAPIASTDIDPIRDAIASAREMKSKINLAREAVEISDTRWRQAEAALAAANERISATNSNSMALSEAHATIDRMEREYDEEVGKLRAALAAARELRSVSDHCTQTHEQYCHICDNAECGDNTNPTIVALRDALAAARDLHRRWMAVLAEVSIALDVPCYDDQPGAWSENARAALRSRADDAGLGAPGSLVFRRDIRSDDERVRTSRVAQVIAQMLGCTQFECPECMSKARAILLTADAVPATDDVTKDDAKFHCEKCGKEIDIYDARNGEKVHFECMDVAQRAARERRISELKAMSVDHSARADDAEGKP